MLWLTQTHAGVYLAAMHAWMQPPAAAAYKITDTASARHHPKNNLVTLSYLARAEDDALEALLLGGPGCAALGHDALVVHDQALEAHAHNALQIKNQSQIVQQPSAGI
jgi:hypothetical protein